MKRFIVMIFSVLLLGAFTCYAGGKKDKAEVTFQTDMHCHKCAEKITENVSFEKGVLDVKVDEKTKQVTFVYDAKKTSVEKLRKSIEKLGYTATVVEKTPKVLEKQNI